MRTKSVLVVVALALMACSNPSLTDAEYIYCGPIPTSVLVSTYNTLSGEDLTVDDFVKSVGPNGFRDDPRWIRACKALYAAR